MQSKVLAWLKKFGPAQNILGPVKGQGISCLQKNYFGHTIPGHNGLKSMTYAKSAPLQEFTNMDERMTNKLLSVQQQAVNLGKDK